MRSSWTVAYALSLFRMLFTTVCCSCAALMAAVMMIALYRITLHPLARIPGPKLAAVSNVWYARKIARGSLAKLGLELHRKYGDIVRVGPNEVWFNTTEAFDQIYRTGKGGFEKSDFYLATALSRPHVDWQLEAHFPDTLDLLSERSMKRYRLQRRLIGRVYSATNVLRHENAVESTLTVAVERLAALRGQEVDLKEWMHMVTVECLGAAVLSWSPGMFRDGTDWGTLTHSYQGWRRKSLFGVFPTMKKLEQWSPGLGRLFASWWGVVYKTPKDFRPFFPSFLIAHVRMEPVLPSADVGTSMWDSLTNILAPALVNKAGCSTANNADGGEPCPALLFGRASVLALRGLHETTNQPRVGLTPPLLLPGGGKIKPPAWGTRQVPVCCCWPDEPDDMRTLPWQGMWLAANWGTGSLAPSHLHSARVATTQHFIPVLHSSIHPIHPIPPIPPVPPVHPRPIRSHERSLRLSSRPRGVSAVWPVFMFC
ncbi:hypothetical protein E4U53_006144 [Claviceps sorghi]|nr:hypothetical protein E4U53_006144 [Claviceps sorghi]